MVAGRAGGFMTPGGGASQFADDDASLAYAAKRKASPGERAAYAMATKAPLLAAPPANRWSVWGASYGGSETIGGNAVVGSQDTRSSVWGLVAGADYKVTPDTLVGFALAGGQTAFSLANGLGSGSADVFQAGVFARQNFGPAYLSGALAYGWHDVTTNRTVALAGVDLLQGRFRAETFSGRFEGGYRFATPFVGITPYAAAQVISFNLPAYAEQTLAGTGMFALNYAAQTTTDTRTELGLRSDKSFALQDAMLTLRGRAAWAHDYDPRPRGDGHLPDAAGRELRGQRRASRRRFGAGQRRRRNEVAERLLAGGDLRGRIRRQRHELCRQGRRQIRLVNSSTS